MTKPDVIVSWPRNNDYPLWRQFMHKNRFRFNDVIIVFTETYEGDDYRSFVRSVMQPDLYKIIESPLPQANEDWRNVAVCEGLKHSTAQWVWFTEQDFFVTDDQFWTDVEAAADAFKAEVIGVLQGARLHPCCLFALRTTVNQSQSNFGVVPNKLDHFGLFTEDLKEMGAKIAILSDNMFKHYNGLSHNWRLVSNFQPAVYKADEFIDYLLQTLNSGVLLDIRYQTIAKDAITKYLPKPETMELIPTPQDAH